MKTPKLYQYQPPKNQIRVFIRMQGQKSTNLNFIETTQDEVYNFIKSIVEKQNLSIFLQGRKISCDIRQWNETFVGKNKSLSFIGLTPEELHNLIIKKIENGNKI
jgi:hypothetical protein